ncbi:hypothetical protein MTR_4g054405 [Medicago truncatula]|uniref:Uncharacterized protein n=1 Tax=Medicago truncatula TaxID=3880 RepID=A0A072UJI8_MEDTR|nr:hypothetical protein MTR_4g054405 [Medicago truncatula]
MRALFIGEEVDEKWKIGLMEMMDNYEIDQSQVTCVSGALGQKLGYDTGHQALNIRAKAHRASSPQRKEQRLTGHQALNSMSMHGLNNLQLGQHRQLI